MRIKDAVALVNEKTDSMDKRYVALENIVSCDGTFVETSATTEGTNSVFQSGDVLFGKLRPYLAKGFIPDFDGICSTEFFVMRPRKQILNKFLLYYFLSPHFIDDIKHKVAGVKMPRTDWGTFGAMEIAPPPLPEQRRIVAYLDEKAAAIDKRVELLEKKKESVTRLKKSIINRAVTRGLDPNAKLKDSGVDWIGEVPEGWGVKRFKDIAAVRANLVAPDDYLDYPQIAPENIEKGTGKLLGYGTVRESGIISGNHLFKKGQIIYSKIRPILNKLVIADFDGLCSADMYPIDVFGELRFVFYQMISPLFVNQVAAIVGMRVKMPKINQEEIAAIGMVAPPLPEQRAIADYLDIECAKIDAAVANLDKQIDAYRRLKRSLIDEVVTGKRKVG